jgi:hypothetical protein
MPYDGHQPSFDGGGCEGSFEVRIARPDTRIDHVFQIGSDLKTQQVGCR